MRREGAIQTYNQLQGSEMLLAPEIGLEVTDFEQDERTDDCSDCGNSATKEENTEDLDGVQETCCPG